MTLRLNRFVVGPDAEGRSAVLDRDLTNVQSRNGFYWRATLWATQETPVDNTIEGDRSLTEGLGARREPFPNGMLCRALEIPPDAVDATEHRQVLDDLVALRSLFAFCKKQKTIFRSPVQGIRVGERTWGIIQPLSQEEVDQAAEAAATPDARLLLVLAAMHAARVKAIREIRLDDADLGNRRIVIGGRTRPLDELTRQILLEWLTHRSTRWPSTANPHLLVNQMSANGTGPVSTSYFAKTALRGKAATLERLRVDRQLQEALACGPDPLHLAAMFGLDPKTAIRYAENARQLLITAAEEQDPGDDGMSTNGGHAAGMRGKDASGGR